MNTGQATGNKDYGKKLEIDYSEAASASCRDKPAEMLKKSASPEHDVLSIIDDLRWLAQRLNVLPSSMLYLAIDRLARLTLSDETQNLRASVRLLSARNENQRMMLEHSSARIAELEQRMKSAIVALESRNG